jgi:hypothetical protein
MGPGEKANVISDIHFGNMPDKFNWSLWFLKQQVFVVMLI